MGGAKVETVGRAAQWRMESSGGFGFYKESDTFRIGVWNWHLSVEERGVGCIRLFPEPSEHPPFARFIIHVTVADSKRTLSIRTGNEKLFRTSDDFALTLETTSRGRLIIDVEFLDLKISFPYGGENVSIWPVAYTYQFHHRAIKSSHECLSRLLNESLFTDITINTIDGKLEAHRAILCASSPVFHSMFSHDFKEKESSTINIDDMTSESCTALLKFLYGNINQDDFWKHRMALLAAANKYDIANLKRACEECFLEDINTGNVLERLQEACLYRLNKLKKGCLTYLLDFGKIHNVKEGMIDLFRKADTEIAVEVFDELIRVWRSK